MVTSSKLLVANWKLNLPEGGIEVYLSGFARGRVSDDRVETVIAPPFPFLALLGEQVKRMQIPLAVAAQNCSAEGSGAFTGEVSASMIAACGGSMVIVGHSERRQLFAESDALIAKKLTQVIDSRLVPVLCIGEDLETREGGRTDSHLHAQLDSAATAALEHAAGIVVAYEPIWAIGTGHVASSSLIAETVEAIRESIRQLWPHELAERVRVLYGGSVTPENVDDVIANGNVDGFLVGGASLHPEKLLAIYDELLSPLPVRGQKG